MVTIGYFHFDPFVKMMTESYTADASLHHNPVTIISGL